MIDLSNGARALGAIAIGALLTGCGGAGDAVDPEVGELVASVELSPTHTVQFRDYGGTTTSVTESYHVDLDRDAPLTLSKMNVGARPLAEIYELFAAGKVDRSVAARLSGIDERLVRLAREESSRNGGSTPPAGGAEVTGPGAVFEPTAATPSNLPAEIEARQGALKAPCGEPIWNWAADAAWFSQTFCAGAFSCRANSQALSSANPGTLSWGWDGPLSRFQATVFNQSHCSQGHWIFQWRNNTGIHTPTNTLMAARLVHTQIFTGGDNVRYGTSMTPTALGSRVAMGIWRTPD